MAGYRNNIRLYTSVFGLNFRIPAGSLCGFYIQVLKKLVIVYTLCLSFFAHGAGEKIIVFEKGQGKGFTMSYSMLSNTVMSHLAINHKRSFVPCYMFSIIDDKKAGILELYSEQYAQSLSYAYSSNVWKNIYGCNTCAIVHCPEVEFMNDKKEVDKKLFLSILYVSDINRSSTRITGEFNFLVSFNCREDNLPRGVTIQPCTNQAGEQKWIVTVDFVQYKAGEKM